MSIKRWAKVYLNLSPIYKDVLFNQPGNQELVSINPRLLAAYCMKMNIQKHYSIDRVKGILNKYYGDKNNYWIDFTKNVLLENQGASEINFQVQMCQDEANIPLIKEKFQSLIKKIYNQNISKGQFSIFCKIFDFLIIKGEVSQFDNYILDLSFRSIEQIVQISLINHENALDAIGVKSLSLLLQKLNKDIYPNTFELIALMNRIKDKEALPPQLCQVFYMFEGKMQGKFDLSNQSYVGLHKQALGYMLWLLHLNQFGEFIFKFVKQDYLFSRYCLTSVVKTCQILQIMDIRKGYKPSQLILLNEIVSKLQNLQQQQQFFQHVKRDIQIQLKLKILKQKLQKSIDQIKFDEIDSDSFIQEINHILIDFKSSFSINTIKKIIKDLIQNPHFGIILREENYQKILSITDKIGDEELYKKIRNRLKKKQFAKGLRPSLLQYLCKINNDQYNQRQYSLMIYSIYELKRIKTLLWKLTKNPQFFKKYFKNSDQQTIKKLAIILNLEYKQLSKHEIDDSLKKIFVDFKL